MGARGGWQRAVCVSVWQHCAVCVAACLPCASVVCCCCTHHSENTVCDIKNASSHAKHKVVLSFVCVELSGEVCVWRWQCLCAAVLLAVCCLLLHALLSNTSQH